MGLLDDAIREHLELKRAHGASDDEIARAEQEALAPARRDPSAPDSPTDIDLGPDEPVAADLAAGEPPPPPPPGAETQAPPPPLEEDDLPPLDEPELDSPPALYDDEAADDRGMPDPALGAPAAHPPLTSEEPIEAEEAPEPGTAKPHGDPAIGPGGDAPELTPDDDEPEPDEVPADERLGEPPADPYRAQSTILDDPLDEPLAEEPPPPATPEPPPPAPGEDVLEETPDFLQETPEHDKLWFEQKPPRDFDFE